MAEKVEKKQRSSFIQRFSRETLGELRKVTWPTTQEAWNLTKIVLLVLAVMSLLLGLLDYVFSQIITRLLG
ncbi:MAG: preprotein translocase subunit SecE [Chloroflexi bacterium]|nr:preprotein translocase subunit SecE [Chloroflexota bacterium]